MGKGTWRKADLIDRRGRRCEECGATEWRGHPIPLEVHHKSPPSEAEADLALLCPNCHSLTPNYRGRGKMTAKTISDEQVVAASVTADTLRQVLITLGLVAKGGNYEVIRKRLIRLGLYEKFKTAILSRHCLQCAEIISSSRRFCSITCSNRFKASNPAEGWARTRKIAWPSAEVVSAMVSSSGYLATGRQLGVSDNAVRKFLRNYGV